MEDWQTPLMKAMARHVTESHGDVLEVGFGRGVSAELIQRLGVASHTIVEPNDHSVRPLLRALAERGTPIATSVCFTPAGRTSTIAWGSSTGSSSTRSR